MSVDQIFNDIEKLKNELKKKYPSNWRVKVANAKSITDMQVDTKEDPSGMMWNRYFLDNLKSQI